MDFLPGQISPSTFAFASHFSAVIMLDDAAYHLPDAVQADILEKLDTSLLGIPWAKFNTPVLRFEAFVEDGNNADGESCIFETNDRLHHIFSVRGVYSKRPVPRLTPPSIGFQSVQPRHRKHLLALM